MKKLFQINSVLNSGSTGRIAEGIGEIAIQNAWESYIAYGRHANESKSHAIKIGNKFDVYSHVLQTRLLDRHGLASKRATVKLIDRIREIGPDIIHLQNIHGYYLNLPVLFGFLKEFDRPVVWTLHDCWAFTGHCAYFDYIGCDLWRSGCNNCPQKSKYPRSWLFDGSLRNYEIKKSLFTFMPNMTLVCPSKWLAGLIEESFLCDYEVRVIHNGIGLNKFKPYSSYIREKYNLVHDFLIVGVANIWDTRKGLQFLVELSNQLKDDEKMILVGLSKKQIGSLPENIIGVEQTESVQDLAEIYSSADVYLNPTLEDNFPTTNLESLACGTPVITFDTGGSPECIDENTGIVVPKGSTAGLIDAISKVRANGKQFYSNNCTQRARYMFNQNDRFAEYMKLYNDVLL
ncbi:MAG: glycosyltransferase [Phycisphaerae bacterium]